MEDKSIYLLFLLAISIHNIEEALWLPAWSKYAKRFTKQVEAQEFRFAVLAIIILALLATSVFIVFPQNEVTRYIYCLYNGVKTLAFRRNL